MSPERKIAAGVGAGLLVSFDFYPHQALLNVNIRVQWLLGVPILVLFMLQHQSAGGSGESRRNDW